MAEAFYNQLTNSNNASSAGTHVEQEGQTLEERKRTSPSKNFFLFDVMDEVGLDVSKCTRTPLTESMVDAYDVIVGMGKKEDAPEWLLHSKKYVQWHVTDPRNQDYTTTVRIRDDIKAKVEIFIATKGD